MHRRALLVALPAPVLRPVRAQTVVYRCGPDGRSYSQQPSRDGVAMRFEAGPDAQARREGRGVAERDARLAQRLVDERLAREAERSAPRHGVARSARRTADGGEARLDAALTRRSSRASDTAVPPRESRRARVPPTTVAANATSSSGR